MKVPSLAAERIADCRFCAASRETSLNWFDVPVAGTDRFVAIPSLGSLTAGWTLVLPRDHAINFASYYCTEEFQALARDIVHKLRSFSRHVAMFEHGPKTSGSETGCGVDHAHVHIVPLPQRMSTTVGQLDPDLVWQKCHFCEIAQVVSSDEYLLYSDDLEEEPEFISVAKLAVPTSQFFRRVIATMLGIPNSFDYRKHPFTKNIEKTYEGIGIRDVNRAIAV